MNKPQEHDYISLTAYTRALEEYCPSIETLRRQLAEKDGEIERLKEEVRVTKEEDFPRKVKAVANNWRITLATSQAREVKLREALSIAVVGGDYLKSERDQFDKLLAQPTDTSALEAMIQKAGEVMRERCLPGTSSMFASRIRLLPQVTLEDIQKCTTGLTG